MSKRDRSVLARVGLNDAWRRSRVCAEPTVVLGGNDRDRDVNMNGSVLRHYVYRRVLFKGRPTSHAMGKEEGNICTQTYRKL